MPKISESGGPTHAGVTSTPTEAQYEDAMSRHGTDEWSEADQRVKDLWDESRARENERSERPSAGSSSSTSSESQPKSSDRSGSSHQSPAPMTENPSVEDPKESSSARQTGGSGKGSKK